MKKIYDSDDWIILCNSPFDIKQYIVDYLKTHNGATIDYIRSYIISQLKININITILEEYMKLWNDNYCTFFSNYGRIFNTKIDGENRWFHFDKTHANSRKPKRYLTEYISKMY